jgi:NAD+ synthase (glutamine-hydrolysing)
MQDSSPVPAETASESLNNSCVYRTEVNRYYGRMNYGFFRAAAASPIVAVADCKTNADHIIDAVREARSNGASLIVFPELSITGYTCGDLFLQQPLQEAAICELERIVRKTAAHHILIVVGLPVAMADAVYNCAAVLYRGKILALIPKSYIPNYGEFYERRQFAPAKRGNEIVSVRISDTFPNVPFGTNILICDKDDPNFVLGVEICEDVWVPLPPSTRHTLAGATVIANLSASNEIVGKAAYRRLLIKGHSAHTVSAYIYADAGHGESSQDMVFASHNIIAENGTVLAESQLFSGKTVSADIDLERLEQERRRTTSYAQSTEDTCSADTYLKIYTNVCSHAKNLGKNEPLCRTIDPHPFVPSNETERAQRCEEVITMQAEGLAKRLRHINAKNAVIGLSGGLDSTLALLVTCRAFDLCNIQRSGIQAVTMPCFGTTDRTYNNACTLAKNTGAALAEINISEAVRLHFRDIGQNEGVHDVTYENCQARERTQVLMDIANKTNGIVIGTGDLSELALGWCTYNGDHMSMYGVNSSIPKTLVRYLVNWFADDTDNAELSGILKDILATPVSPELLPPEQGAISQKTEDIVGPYELHDFYLYYLLRFGFSPAKILFLADNTSLPYTHEFKLRWIRTFYKRFFAQQFKRSCMPDGAKVGSVNLSPRGDWRMPSDACASVWLNEIDKLQ